MTPTPWSLHDKSLRRSATSCALNEFAYFCSSVCSPRASARADLERLDRYERRAFSRRRRAIASLTRLEESA